MELKLVVLAGAKEGTQIPLKKDKFIIGRASDCTLRAGSSAISRRHCAIVRKDDGWVVRDLGSRNGTFLNDSAVASPTPLKVGDELRVGPLHFRIEPLAKAAGGSKIKKPAAEAKAATPAKPAEPQDINRAKQPPVKDVAEVVQRTAGKGDSSTSEDDISRWLLGIDAATGGDMLRETQTLSMEETTTINRAAPAKQGAADKPANGEAAAEDAEEASATAGKDAAAPAEKTGSGGWKFFKMGKKGAAKKAPGKLPPRPAEASKDSREAAADILREMTRRR
jgi:predicted component of type VI protein secretion system